MTLAAVEGAARSFRVTPVGAGHPVPPVVVVADIDPAWRLLEDDRAGHQHLRLGARVILGPRHTLGDGDIAGGLDEAAEGGVGDRVAVDPEAADHDFVDWRFLRIVSSRSP